MRNPLDILAEKQVKYSRIMIVVAIIVTAVMATGVPRIRLETDFQSSLPDTIPAVKTQDTVESKFGSSNSIIVLFQTGENSLESSFVTDVRDPRLIRSQKFLVNELEKESNVGDIQSPSSFFQRKVPETMGKVKKVLSQVEAGTMFNRDYTASLMYVQLTEEMTEENIRKATSTINENLEQTPMYPGVEITVTGLPVIRTDMASILVSDSVRTIFAASILILVLLVLTRGILYGPVTFIPLFVGLIWTLGAMGMLGIPLTIATIALGSMILGLGVEYGSFITERILREKQKLGIEQALKDSVPTTGMAILGSSSTTVIGFSALLIASISFVRNLGLTLALGIVLTLIAALVFTPALIVEMERWKK
mgnify:CR=1 FL=1